jgi:glucose/mannose transport system substrate-binding protein
MIRLACATAMMALLGLFSACGTPRGSADASDAGPRTAPVPPLDPNEARPIELFSWWARVGESDALGALTREHQHHYPGDVLINATAELSGLARSTLRLRMQRNEAPDTFQANVGRDLMQWVLVNQLDDRESRLVALDDVIEDVPTWRKTMPPPILDELSYGGKLYAVPSNVHRINAIFYSKKLFRRYGLGEPKTVADLAAMAQKLAGTGVPLIALGSREPWTLALLTFECLLVAREGPTFYDNYFRGNMKPDDPRIVSNLKAALELFAMLNEDHAQLSWLQALEMVVRGRAAMTVMGDWARVSFNARGFKLGDDYEEIAFPGTEQTFVYTSDTFPLALEARNRAGAIRLLKTIGSAEGQRVMNEAKMALSARMDVSPPDDPMLVAKHALLEKGPLVLALSGLVPGRFADDLAAGLAEMVEQHDIEPALQTLRSRYALLK